MLWFQNKRTGDMICMETTILGQLRIQTVLDSGFYCYQKPRDPNPHCHLNHEVYFVDAGSCTTRCTGREYVCEADDLLLINAGAEHSVQQLTKEASLYSFRCSFYPICEQEQTLYMKLLECIREPLHLRGQTSLVTLLKQIRWELAQQQMLCEEKLQGLLQVFYVEWMRCLLDVASVPVADHPFSVTPGSGQGLKGFRENTPQEFYMDILDEFFTHLPIENTTLTELAGRLYLSVSQTQRLIKRYYGMSFQQKLIHAKIRKSMRLMATTDTSLERIAEQVGYDSYNAFFEAFTALTGKTPSQYRQLLEQAEADGAVALLP